MSPSLVAGARSAPRAVLGAKDIELRKMLFSIFRAVLGAKDIELRKMLFSIFRAVLGAKDIELRKMLFSIFRAVLGAKDIELRKMLFSIFLSIGLVVGGCGGGAPAPVDFEFANLADAPQRLSDYGLFAGEAREQRPAAGVVPYDLRSPLFSDYAAKLRFVKLPAGQAAHYSPDHTLEFPIGTIIAKTFAYPADLRQPDGELDLLETRILLHQKTGWIGLPYVWNEEETEATLKLAGTMLSASWTDGAGQTVDHQYLVPNANQCKGCHKVEDDTFAPIGPKARYLNRDFAYAEGTENQLAHWSRAGILEGAPPPEQAPQVPVWDDPSTGSLEDRARTYLEINCAHCHSTGGPARTTGLDLTWGAHAPVKLGVFKFPVAAGRGSGDRLYGIVPGEPDQSILMYRMTSLDPGVMMPELGRRMVHHEGVELLREWIAAMAAPADSASDPRTVAPPTASIAAPAGR